MQCLPYSIPGIWKANVVADLETFVTPQQVPSWLPTYEQRSLVEERIKALVKRYRDEEARARQVEAERRRAEAARALAQTEAETAKRNAEEEQQRAAAREKERIRALIEHGLQYLNREVADWDVRDRWKVREEVEKGLQEEVRADWTERQVERWVDDELDDWEEEPEDE